MGTKNMLWTLKDSFEWKNVAQAKALELASTGQLSYLSLRIEWNV